MQGVRSRGGQGFSEINSNVFSGFTDRVSDFGQGRVALGAGAGRSRTMSQQMNRATKTGLAFVENPGSNIE
ncbi:unnamed protein product [Parascedosporium putredinis]|uniref:Uncharacterized protein n=1 Tax=Parascedosporium putredinis TaxID=1442378 RepID=A0A9P1GZS9_9PEZI|nr:unnamed protein product [Parascedosporium putredinis]CAI7992139.1 unnamed protein product [Parascedosporium putredinis]